MKRLFFIFLLLPCFCFGQNNSLLVVNTETGKKHKIKEGRRIIFYSNDYPALTKAKVLEIKDGKLVVERIKGRREIELDAKQLSTIGMKTGGTMTLAAVYTMFLFPFHNLNQMQVQFKRCDLSDDWSLVLR